MTETTTEITPLTLTADDAAAIRGATSYVVRLEGETARLELIRRERTPNRKDGYERTNIERRRTLVGSPGTFTQATFVQVYPGGAWQALARLVRAGDTLRFYASEDNSNGYTRAAIIPPSDEHPVGYPRIYVDELCVDIIRGRRSLVERLVLAHSICPDNTARAVIPHRAGKQYPREVA